jgi:hypothetical protein
MPAVSLLKDGRRECNTAPRNPERNHFVIDGLAATSRTVVRLWEYVCLHFALRSDGLVP